MLYGQDNRVKRTFGNRVRDRDVVVAEGRRGIGERIVDRDRPNEVSELAKPDPRFSCCAVSGQFSLKVNPMTSTRAPSTCCLRFSMALMMSWAT